MDGRRDCRAVPDDDPGLRHLGGRPAGRACTRRPCASTTGSAWSRRAGPPGGGRRYSRPRHRAAARGAAALPGRGRQPRRHQADPRAGDSEVAARCSDAGRRRCSTELEPAPQAIAPRWSSGTRPAGADVTDPRASHVERNRLNFWLVDSVESRTTERENMEANKLTTKSQEALSGRRPAAPPPRATRRSSRRTCWPRCWRRPTASPRPLLRGRRRRPADRARRGRGAARGRLPSAQRRDRGRAAALAAPARVHRRPRPSGPRQLGDEYVSTEHLLVGLAADGGAGRRRC